MPPNFGWQRHSIFPLFVLGLFTLLALIFTRPLIGQLLTLALGGDALVNLRIFQWGTSSLLGGPEALLNLPNGNIFYPYRSTFLFSEHLLPITALMLPFLSILSGPLAAFNLYTLLTFILTGFSVWLLITYWTGNRWVGLPAGMIVAFAPARLLITDQPNILTIQWMPLAVLTLNRWLDKGERQDWWLALLFVNLQILSATNYLVHVFILLALLVGIYALAYQDTITRRHVLGILSLALATGVINTPVWWAYFRVSATLGIERDLGAIQLGSAHFLNYLMATPNNLIYGTLMPKLAALATSSPGLHPVIALFPGLIALLLTPVALIFLPRPWSRRQQFVIFTLLAWLMVGFFMSLGINDHAFGTRLAPYLRFLLPYRWLYDYVPGFKGFRVPARFAVLVLLALGGMAAYGILALHSKLGRPRANLYPFLSMALAGLVAIEFITLPLEGERYPYGDDLPPIYPWLASSTTPDAAIIELPYDDWSYMYYSVFHGRRMVNGASSFNPSPLGDEASNLLDRFPSWRSIEWLQRLGVDYVILHPAEYEQVYGPGSWDRVWAGLLAYLGSIRGVTQVGNDFALQLAPPICPTQPDEILVTMEVDPEGEPAGKEAQVHVSFANPTAAGYAFDPNLPSFVRVEGTQRACPGGGCRLAFHEPLVLLPGQTSEVTVSMGEIPMVSEFQVTALLTNLERTLQPELQGPDESEGQKLLRTEHPERFVADFADGARLVDYKLSSDELVVCRSLDVNLHWQAPVDGERQEKATVQLVDRYGWPAVESQIQPWLDAAPGSPVSSRHRLPIPGSLPVGQYTVAVRLQKADDASLPAHTSNGSVERLLLGKIMVRPQPPDLDTDNWQPVGASIADTVTLAAYRVDGTQLAPGDWLRLTLVWQVDKAPGRDATVFTQLIGPDGQVWGQHDNPPRGGWYPTSLWQPGQLVADDYLLRVSPEAPPGHYFLVTGMYLPDTLERLPVQSMEGSPATDAILLTEIEIGSQTIR